MNSRMVRLSDLGKPRIKGNKPNADEDREPNVPYWETLSPRTVMIRQRYLPKPLSNDR